MSDKRLILIGGGGHCRSVIDVIEQTGKFQIVGIVDQPEMRGESIYGYEVIGSDEDLPRIAQSVACALITVGQIRSADLRQRLFDRAKQAGFQLPVVVSPRAYLSQHAQVGEGTVLMHDALINAGAAVGVNCIINSKALVEHDTEVGDHCHISTGAIVNGGVVVGRGSFVGSNATTNQYIAIDAAVFVRAGSVVK